MKLIGGEGFSDFFIAMVFRRSISFILYLVGVPVLLDITSVGVAASKIYI